MEKNSNEEKKESVDEMNWNDISPHKNKKAIFLHVLDDKKRNEQTIDTLINDPKVRSEERGEHSDPPSVLRRSNPVF